MTGTRSLARRTGLTLTAAAAALVLAACGNDNGSSGAHEGHDAGASPSASQKQGDHNKADVAFAKGMIPHHRQAVEMSDMAAKQASSKEVKDLAEQIEKAQGPEIETMSGWLKSWGEKVPADTSGMDHGGMDHGDMGEGGSSAMPGMMDQKQMDELKKSSGKDFDTKFMTMMVDHHKGAVEMAETEKTDGSYEPAKKMADAIITSQTAEITQMNKLLGKN